MAYRYLCYNDVVMSYYNSGQDGILDAIIYDYNIVPPDDILYDVIKPGDGTVCFKLAKVNGATNILIKYDSAEY